jgi:HK97 family phage major capsid protein
MQISDPLSGDLMARNPNTISEEIRAIDVEQSTVDTELFGLIARNDLTAGEKTRAEQLTRASENSAKKRADLEHEHRGAVAAREAQIDEIREQSRVVGATTPGVDYGPELVSGRSVSDRQLWGDSPTFSGQSETQLARSATRILERAADLGDVDPDAIERIGTLVDKGENQSYAARFVAASSDPEYVSSLEKIKYGADDANGRLRWTPSETTAFLRAESFRAAMSSTAGNGGVLIPFTLDPNIILTNAGAANPFRKISRVVSVASNPWHGVASPGVSAEWTSEAAEVSDASPSFVQPTITAVRGDCYVQASIELEADSSIGTQIGMLLADAKYNLESSAFVNGTGTTQPWGIVSRLNATTASRVAASSNGNFLAADVFALVNSLPARYQANPSWVGHWGVANLVRQFTSSAAPQAGNYWTDLGGGTPPELLGAPFFKSSSMVSSLSAATASTDNILVLGDFSQFVIVDALGSQLRYVPTVIGTNRRPTGEVGWISFFRTGSDCTDTSAFRLLQV